MPKSLALLKSFFIVIILAMVSAASFAASFLPPDQAFGFAAVMKDGNHARVTFTIAPDYYMYRDDFSASVISPDGDVKQLGEIKLPAGITKFDENFGKNVQIFHGSVAFDVPVSGSGLFKLIVTSRGCADGGLCYPPRKTQAVLEAVSKTVTGPVAKAENTARTAESKQAALEKTTIPKSISAPNEIGAAQVAETTQVELPATEVAGVPSSNDNSNYAKSLFTAHNIPVALALMFGLGVLLSLTPCMLPMLPILSTIIAGQQDVTRRRGLILALAYVTGMALVYALIGLAAAKTGAGLHKYLQSPWVLGAFALMLGVLALSLFDVFHIHLPQKWQLWLSSKTHGKGGVWGVGLMGAASAIISSPCVTAPLVGVITYVAQTGNVILGGLALFVLAYGMGLPLILLGAGMGQILPKHGAWLVHVKHLIGVIMLAAALWIAQPLWGKYWQKAWGSTESVATFQSVKSLTALNEVVANSDKPIFLDLYADWCRSCIEMEKKTFPDAAVKERMAQMKLLRVDMTAFDAEDAALLKHFGLYGPPAMIVLEPISGKEKMRVIGYEGPEQFVKSLDGLK